MTQEEADLYWSTREHKKWVVSLKARKTRLVALEVDGRRTLRPLSSKHDMYVSARTRNGAITCALDNAPASNSWAVSGARLARPFDLGCVRIAEAQP